MSSKSGTREPREHTSWLFLDPEAVPPRWRSRGRPVVMVPLLPAEADTLLEGGPAAPELDPEDVPLAALLARGLSIGEIAGELGLNPRSVQRRLARLYRSFAVDSKAALSSLLAARGF